MWIRWIRIRIRIRNTAAEDIDVYLEWLSVCVEEAQRGDAELIAGLLLWAQLAQVVGLQPQPAHARQEGQLVLRVRYFTCPEKRLNKSVKIRWFSWSFRKARLRIKTRIDPHCESTSRPGKYGTQKFEEKRTIWTY